jgi:hypothetical protein
MEWQKPVYFRVTNGSGQGIGGGLLDLRVYKLSDGTRQALDEKRVILFFCADKEMKIIN